MKRFFVQLKDHTQVFVCVVQLTSRYNKGKYRGTNGRLSSYKGSRGWKESLQLVEDTPTLGPWHFVRNNQLPPTTAPYQKQKSLSQILPSSVYYALHKSTIVLSRDQRSCATAFFSVVYSCTSNYISFYKKYPLNFVSQNVRFHLWISQCRQQKK